MKAKKMIENLDFEISISPRFLYIPTEQIIEDSSLKNGFHQDLCTAIDSDGSPLHQDTHISRPDSPSRSANLQIIAQNLDFSFWESDSPFGRSHS